jgi:hypothetical protein
MAGAGGMAPRCTDIVDDAALITPSCPISAGCPTAPDCTFCQDCADEAGIGAPLAEGTYELTNITLENSACGAWDTTSASGVLVVSGSSLTLAWTRPVAIGSTAPSTAAYSFTLDGNSLVLTETCPETNAPTPVSYATAQGTIYFMSSLPGQVDFSSVFERR